ncbi:hypothetical protein CNMCM5623_000697 [Aspergillus felis]|uniref:Uncharacterized protein n=1 Tax=Aspergillus felis TaxID=1287682 RepID=A0A8H6QQ93_9EURO|nr:hypothetical protein CNMCM5623_000697 [Aspergillus felis]KAF7175926.1 hypothetical protein CNMCM7691_000458 [Aspergillus felis]
MTTYLPRQSSVDLDSADRPFDNIINFRDVGRSINQLMGSRILKEGVLFRSARLDDASERDRRRLAEELHISTVLDLRSMYGWQSGDRARNGHSETSRRGCSQPRATVSPSYGGQRASHADPRGATVPDQFNGQGVRTGPTMALGLV